MIYLKSIKIRNFLGIKKYDFDYSNNGVFLILGENGSGKSSFLDALIWVIFNKVTRGNLLKNDIVNEYSEDGCYVQLNFEYNNQEYQIIRSINNSKYGNGLKLFIDGVNLSDNKGNQNVLEEIFSDYNTFINTVIFPQSFKETFLGSTDSTQKAMFEKILNLQKLNEYKDRAKQIYDEKEKEKDEYVKQIDVLMAENQQNMKTLIDIITNKKNEFSLLESNLQTMENEIKSIDLESLKNKIADVYSKKEELNIGKANIENKIKVLQQNRNTTEQNYQVKFNKIKNRITKYLNNLDNLYTEKFEESKQKFQNEFNNIKQTKENELNNQINEINNEIKKLSNDKNSILMTINNNENEKNEIYKKYNALINELRTKISNIDMTINMKNNQINNMKNSMNLNGECPTCHREMDEYGIKQLENKIDELQKEINKLSIEKTEYENKVNQFKKEMNIEIEKIENMTYELKNAINDIDNKVLEFNNEIDKIKNNLNEELKSIFDGYKEKLNDISIELKNTIENKKKYYNDRMARVQYIYNNMINKLISDYQNELNNMTTQLKTIENDINGLNVSIKELQEEYDKKSDILNKYNNIVESKNKLSNEIKDLELKLENDKKEMEKTIADKQKILQEIVQEIEIMKFWKDAFTSQGIKNFIIGKVIPEFEKLIQTHLSKISDRFTVKISNTKTTQSGTTKNQLNVMIYRKDGTETKFDKLSGGEKRILDVATMMALHDLSIKYNDIRINVLFADEIFDSLDADHAEGVVYLLKDISKDKAFYITTHNQWWKNQDVDDIIEFMREDN